MSQIAVTSLKKLGLDQKEVEIYLACVRKGPLSPSELSAITKIKRSTIYFYLERLKELGLITLKTKGKRKKIYVTPFSAFQNLISERKEKISNQEQTLKDLLPTLERMAHERSAGTTVEFLEGQKGVVTLIEEIIKENKNIYWLGAIETILQCINDDKFFKLMTWRRMNQQTISFAITDQSITKWNRYYSDSPSFRQFRFLEKSFNIPAVLAIFGTKCALISVRDDKPSIVVIQDQSISEIMTFMFLTLWDNLKAEPIS